MDLSLLRQYALQFAGTPYRWGGDDPVGGFDCSGGISELLRATGVVPYNFRETAQGIFNTFDKKSKVGTFELAALSFYGKSFDTIVHIGFCLDSETMLEAGGGDSLTTNDEAAAKANAFWRMRPIQYRKDFLLTLRPFYPGNF